MPDNTETTVTFKPWRLWAIDEATMCAMIADVDAQIDVRGLHEGGRRLVQHLAWRKTATARRCVVGLRYEAHPPGVTPPGCRVLAETPRLRETGEGRDDG